MHIRKLTTITTGILFAGLMTVGSSQLLAADKELKFGHVGKPGSLFEYSVNDFAKRANAALAGKGYKVVGYGSSQLGKDKELLKKLKLGTITFSLPSSVMSSVSDSFGVFDMPYLIKNREHMKKILKPVVWKKLNKVVKRKKYEIIGVWENGFRHITNNKRPINTPADLKGIKLRTPNSIWRVKMFKAYGANPSPLSFSELFSALKTGTFDGQENPFAQIHSAKLQEVQKYLSLTGHVYTPAYVLVSRKHWKKMPKDIKKILKSAAKETQKATYKKAAELENSLLADLKKSGMKVNKANHKAFVDASGPIYDQFSTSVNGAFGMLNQINRLGEGL
jgi:tripartite ATP-independent transporter DctP family solute receptor